MAAIFGYPSNSKRYTGNSCTLSIGPLTKEARAKRAICDLVDAEKEFNASLEARSGQPNPPFNESTYYKHVFEKYSLSLPK
ncbi:MAG: hypothetical protein Q7J54_03540 [Candidatus Woesearchaeota archaeon]|nr:hypothetical protein [Candidatus Woesearchaeota archaeon]